MKLTSDHPFWSIRNGLPRTYPALDSDLRCDVAVVGGGITGALVAYHLVEAGVDVVLLDKRDIGTGSTSGCTALVQYEVDIQLRELIQKIGERDALRSYELCYQSVLELDHLAAKLKIGCDYETKPSLYLARHKSEITDFEEEYKLRKQLGFDLRLLDQTQIEKLFPFSRPAALLSENSAQLDPHCLTHGLLKAAVKRGLRVFDRTEVSKFMPNARGITLQTTRGFTLKARKTVIAAGFESKEYLKAESGSLNGTYAFISEPLAEIPGWYRRCLIWESGTPYLYLRTTPDNRIIVGGEDEAFHSIKERDDLLAAKTRTLLKKFSKLFPALNLEVAYSWAGTFGGTKDGLAYIGPEKSLPHAYFALGYGGNGITYSQIAATIIRDDFLGHKNLDARLFRFNR